MKPPFNQPVSSSIYQQIEDEENNYQQALKMDKPFHVLKDIKNRVKLLKQQLTVRVSKKSGF